MLSEPGRERTFRDPAGWVEVHPKAVYRFVYPAAQLEFREFNESSLAATLVREGRLISSTEVPRQQALDTGLLSRELADAGVAVFRHPRIPFVSYPWEWCPAQWLAAAELTLRLNRELIQQGWILKDATPLNVLFDGSRPVFVDAASVARLEPTVPIWYAYSQFVRTFLLPMLAHARLGWPLRATMLRRDGLEPEELYPALNLTQRVRQPALSAVTLPSLLGKARRKQAADAANESRPAGKDPELVREVLHRTSAGLEKQMRRAMPQARATVWTSYSGAAGHYSEADHAAKRAFVSAALQRARPEYVLDVGANAGVYSSLAVEAGTQQVVALDTDLPTLDRLYQRVRASGEPIVPLVVDLANPTPGTGWRNRETVPFLERATGRFDTVLMLALIHHLLLHDHVPLPAVAALASTLTTRTLIIEWVPPSDPMFRELVRGRDAIFASLTEDAFRTHFGVYFQIVTEQTLGNGRILFHLDKAGESGTTR